MLPAGEVPCRSLVPTAPVWGWERCVWGMGFLLNRRKAANISFFFFLFKSDLHLILSIVHHHPHPAGADLRMAAAAAAGELSSWPRPLLGPAPTWPRPPLAPPLSALSLGPPVGAGLWPGGARGPPGENGTGVGLRTGTERNPGVLPRCSRGGAVPSSPSLAAPLPPLPHPEEFPSRAAAPPAPLVGVDASGVLGTACSCQTAEVWGGEGIRGCILGGCGGTAGCKSFRVLCGDGAVRAAGEGERRNVALLSWRPPASVPHPKQGNRSVGSEGFCWCGALSLCQEMCPGPGCSLLRGLWKGVGQAWWTIGSQFGEIKPEF